jgi:outer membrane protein assembly factor BamA
MDGRIDAGGHGISSGHRHWRSPKVEPARPRRPRAGKYDPFDQRCRNAAARADTVRSYIRLRQGQVWTQAAGDQALKDLYATELFADVSIRNTGGDVTIEVRENPVINRIILEGNKRIKNDKIEPEIKLAPRQIYSRSKVRADVARIIELYKRQGRFAAQVEPKLVQLDQNRVDIVFEITEGPKSKVRQINIIGNDKFSDNEAARRNGHQAGAPDQHFQLGHQL